MSCKEATAWKQQLNGIVLEYTHELAGDLKTSFSEKASHLRKSIQNLRTNTQDVASIWNEDESG